MSTPALPSLTELQTLPRWAIVAFAARSTARIRPLFRQYWPSDGPVSELAALDRRVDRALLASKQLLGSMDYYTPDDAEGSPVLLAIVEAVMAVEAALDVAFHEANGHDMGGGGVAGRAVRASGHTIDACKKAGLDPEPLKISMRSDFEILSRLSKDNAWGDASPVDVALLGDLWPVRKPPGWPSKERLGNRAYRLEVEVPGHVGDLEIAHELGELVRLLDRLNRARGGSGIRVDDDLQIFDSVRQAAPQPTGGH